MTNATSDPDPLKTRDLNISRLILVWLIVLGIGLASRTFARPWSPDWMLLYGGDALWAAALYGFVLLWRRSMGPNQMFLITYVLSCLVEFSQLYQAPWINQIRHTVPFNFILGQGFLWSDLVAYAIGAGGMWWVDRRWFRNSKGELLNSK
jgi:hypothetical protein